MKHEIHPTDTRLVAGCGYYDHLPPPRWPSLQRPSPREMREIIMREALKILPPMREPPKRPTPW